MGLRVLELEGLGPGPMAACVLADFGADVVSVSRVDGGRVMSQRDPVSRGKRSIALDLKSHSGLAALRRLALQVDVFIEAFRPGVAEKLGVGPEVLCAANPRLIYGRMTGWGQGGTEFERMAGHDANYIALSGVLDFFRRGKEPPLPPANFAGDYAGGAMMLAMGVLLALVERSRSGKGQVIDAAMVDGANYVALPLFKWAQEGIIVPMQKDGHVDAELFFANQAPHWSDMYLCKENPDRPGTRQYMSVQAIEPQFYALLLRGLGLENVHDLPGQNERALWPVMKTRFAHIFLSKTRDEWADVFRGSDACCVPVLNAREAAVHPHSVARGSFLPTPEAQDLFEPAPAPKLSRTPGHKPRLRATPGADTTAVLQEYGFTPVEVDALLKQESAVDVRRRKPESKL